MKLIGLGNANASLSVYIENTPPLEQYQTLSICRPMQNNEIASIARETGNHWRKIFNVYAKIIFELTSTKYKDWQTFREEELLQIHSQQNLLFNLSHRTILQNIQPTRISIIMGKTYATKLGFAETCQWLTTEFAVDKEKNLIICPYFDYRQLSNVKVTYLCQLINRLTA